MAADARFDDHAARHELPHPLAALYDRLRTPDDAARLAAALAFAEGVARYLAWTLLADAAARNAPRAELAKYVRPSTFGVSLHVIEHFVHACPAAQGRLYPELDALLRSSWWTSLDRLRALRNEAAHHRVDLQAAAGSLLTQHRADLDTIIDGCAFLLAYPLGSLGRVRIDTTGRPHGVWRSCRGTTPRGIMVDLPDATGIPSDQLLLVDTARGVTLTLAPFVCLLHDELCWLDLPAPGDAPRAPYLSPVPGRRLPDGIPAGLYDPSGAHPDGVTLDAWLDDPTLRPRYTALPAKGGALALIVGASKATMAGFPSRAPPPPVEPLPQPSATSSQTSLPPVVATPRPVRRLDRRTFATLALATLVLAIAVGAAGTYALRRDEPVTVTAPVTVPPVTEAPVTVPAPVMPTLTSLSPRLEARLRQWHSSIRSPTISEASMGRFYADLVRFRGSMDTLRDPAWISAYWQTFSSTSGATLTIDWAASQWRREPLSTSMDEHAACRLLASPTSDLWLVRLAATEVDPTRLTQPRGIPCERLSGVYLVRLREVAGRGLMICHETWSPRDGICAPGSCPDAAVCRGAGR